MTYYEKQKLLNKISSVILAVITAMSLMTISTASVGAAINKPTKLKLTGVTDGFKVKFNAVSNAKKYKLQYSASKKFKKEKTTTVNLKSNTKKTIKKLAPDVKYYVRVRTYKGNRKSKWSAVKSVKTKYSARK